MTGRTRIIDDEKALGIFASRLAPLLKKGDVVTLIGGLGAGKTAFARALIHALDPLAGEVPSPTFTLVQTYDLPELSIWHFDLYRLENKKQDILELGWEDARRYGVSLVEWPDRLGSLLPKDRLEITIDFDDSSENRRVLGLMPFGSWQTRLQGIES